MSEALQTTLVPRLPAPCRNARVWNHPAAARRRGLARVPRTDAAMFPLGSRRASRAPAHDHSRPIQPTACRDAQDSHPRIRDHREASCQLRPLSSIKPRVHPAPTAPTESPAPKDRPRQSSLLHGHRTAQVVCSTPAATSSLRRVLRYYRRCAMQCPHHSNRLCPAYPLTPTPGPSAVPAALAV